jgi:ribosomal subunit interface protein
MNINIKTTQITSTPAIDAYVNKRLDKISKLLSDDPTVQCDVELALTTAHHHKGQIFRADIHIVGANKNLYAASEQSDLYSAIDSVQDHILVELKTNKEKQISMIRRGGARVKDMVKGLWPWGKRSL